MKLIGLTGGIGSGKSTVANIFRTLGIPVYESDEKAKMLMNTNLELKEKIEQLLGPSSYLKNEINRQWIAEKVFNDKNLLKQLNALVHPAVKADAIHWANADENSFAPYVIKESALLFEENLLSALDGIILVIAPTQIRIDRVMKRDGVTQEQVEDRIQHQWPDEQKIPLANYVVFNDEQRSLIEQITDIDRMIRAV